MAGASVDADAEARSEDRASDRDRADEHAEEERRPAPGREAADFRCHWTVPFKSGEAVTPLATCFASSASPRVIP